MIFDFQTKKVYANILSKEETENKRIVNCFADVKWHIDLETRDWGIKCFVPTISVLTLSWELENVDDDFCGKGYLIADSKEWRFFTEKDWEIAESKEILSFIPNSVSADIDKKIAVVTFQI